MKKINYDKIINNKRVKSIVIKNNIDKLFNS